MNSSTRIGLAAGAMALALSLSGCFTGVESTGKINLSKKDLIATAPTEEEKFLQDISPEILRDWSKGKIFKVADEKFRLIVSGPNTSSIHLGDTISFIETRSVRRPDGEESTLILFQTNGGDVAVEVDKILPEALETLTFAEIPMLIDLDLVDRVRLKLMGKTFWTLTALWYEGDISSTETYTYKKGRKYVPVKVVDVTPGNSFFPLMVTFSDDQGRKGGMLMNIGSAGNDSRSFGKLFSLTDPRLAYKSISEENWEAIQREEVRLGMTKEESRLAKGSPSDVDTGHSYSNALEIWYYPDGSFLHFVDGLLVRYK